MKEHLLKYDFFTEKQVDRVISSFTKKHFGKKDHIVRAGEPARYVYFILKGCVRSFLIDFEGKEHTILFGTEGYWIGDLQAFIDKKNNSYNYQALEKTDALAISKQSWDKLIAEEPSFAKYVSILFRNALIVQQDRIVEIFTLSAEDRYYNLIANRKDLLNRVSQKYIASYIGITPAFLSQIRKKAAKRSFL